MSIANYPRGAHDAPSATFVAMSSPDADARERLLRTVTCAGPVPIVPGASGALDVVATSLLARADGRDRRDIAKLIRSNSPGRYSSLSQWLRFIASDCSVSPRRIHSDDQWNIHSIKIDAVLSPSIITALQDAASAAIAGHGQCSSSEPRIPAHTDQIYSHV